MATNPGSAKNGTVTWNGTSLDVTDINIEDNVDIDVYASSLTGGQKSRLEGHADTTGSFTMIQPPPFFKGAEGSLVVSSDSGEVGYNGGAIITSVTRSIPVEAGTRKEWTVNWGQKPDASSSGSLDSGVAS